MARANDRLGVGPAPAGSIGMHVAVLLATLALATASLAAPCRGGSRFQLRWSAKTQTAVIAFSTTQCGVPESCGAADGSAAGSRTNATAVTQPPISVTVRDVSGRTLTGTVDPTEPSCGGRCGQFTHGGCEGGSETHRLANGFVRYVLRAQQRASVVVNKLRIAAPDAPALVAPLTVTVRDAGGYTVEADLKKCRSRESGGSVSLFCS
jgi:hypothetical protein